MKTILVGAAAFGCVTGPSGAGENGNPRFSETGVDLSAISPANAWSNTAISGAVRDLTLPDKHCSNWTNGVNDFVTTGRLGAYVSTGTFWTDFPSTTTGCGNQLRLYCFQQ